MEKVSFVTADGVTIAGNYWQGSSAAVLLLHMMPAAKESWNPFAKILNKNGFSILAIDLRGHGESTKQGGKELDFRKFSDADHQASIKDAEAGIEYLKGRGAKKTFIAGASIGANLALLYQSQHPEIEKTVLLSAGMNYRGVLVEPAARRLQAGQASFIAEGSSDSSCSGAAVKLGGMIKNSKTRSYYTAAHGTSLFTEQPQLMKEIVEWLKK
ncbi:MAG: alpha/beta fold hydrolase [Candidatus Aenigmarchaeota archaeon]|nr:alpha/beta fold hydrolase [Candidatus Aenigmarchaeota archaeon]